MTAMARGLAINDLDNVLIDFPYGLLDIVLANLGGDNAILHGIDGDLKFERQALPSATPSRGAGNH